VKWIIIIFLISVSLVQAQQQKFDRATYYSYGIKLFSEAHTLPDNSSDSVQIAVLYKVTYETLLFTQSNTVDNPGRFQSIPLIEIFFRDQSGIIRNRTLLTDTVWADDYEQTQRKDLYFTGFMTTKLYASDYSCTVQLLDRYKKPAEVNEFNIKSGLDFTKLHTIASPVLTYASDNMPDYKTVPFVLSNKINFTSKDAKILVPATFSNRYNVFNYSIVKNISQEDKFWNQPINLTGRVVPSADTYIKFEHDEEYGVISVIKSDFNFQVSNDEQVNAGVMVIELPSEQLSPGSYSLTIKPDGLSDSVSYNFEVVWVDMPLALRNPQYALDLMYLILTDEEYESMNTGDDLFKATKIMEYWKAKDPSRSTPYNEAMTEFFKRVDYAFFNFQTLREKDGAKTERGKIYILYSKPDKIDKILEDGKQYEIWTYAKLGKTFYFELVTNGLYNLTKIIE